MTIVVIVVITAAVIATFDDNAITGVPYNKLLFLMLLWLLLSC